MKASDLLKGPQLKQSHAEGEEYQPLPTQSQEEWWSLSQMFATSVSHAEATLMSEADLELARKELVQRGVIRQEKIEKKTYGARHIQTLKPHALATASKRLRDIAEHLKVLEEEEAKQREIVVHFHNKEFVKRKQSVLYVHIHNKIFLPISAIEEGIGESFLYCTFFFRGAEHKGYLAEKEVAPFSSADRDALQAGILAFRDKARNTQIIREYFTKQERALVQRVSARPDTQSAYAVFLLSALKIDYTFEESVSILNRFLEGTVSGWKDL